MYFALTSFSISSTSCAQKNILTEFEEYVIAIFDLGFEFTKKSSAFVKVSANILTPRDAGFGLPLELRNAPCPNSCPFG